MPLAVVRSGAGLVINISNAISEATDSKAGKKVMPEMNGLGGGIAFFGAGGAAYFKILL